MSINLNLDGNYHLYKNTFILKNKNMRLNGNLSLVLMRDFMNIMSTYSFDNIVLVSDTRQKIWRKDIYSY